MKSKCIWVVDVVNSNWCCWRSTLIPSFNRQCTQSLHLYWQMTTDSCPLCLRFAFSQMKVTLSRRHCCLPPKSLESELGPWLAVMRYKRLVPFSQRENNSAMKSFFKSYPCGQTETSLYLRVHPCFFFFFSDLLLCPASLTLFFLKEVTNKLCQ